MTVLRTKAGHVPVWESKSWPLAGLSRSWLSVGRTSSGVDLIASNISNLSYGDLYRQQPWVAIVVNKLARGIARLPLKTYEHTNDSGDRGRVRGHPLPQLLSSPYPRGSGYSLIEAVVSSLCVYGNALLVKFRPQTGAAPSELWPVPWPYVRVVAGKTDPVDRYEYQGPAGRKFFQPDDVVHFQWWAPDGVTGVSPLEPLRRTLAMEDAAQRYAAASFQNGARPSGALVSEGKLTGDQRDALKATIAASTSGPDRAFGMLLLENGMDWKPFSHTAQEAEVIAHRKLNREEVAAAFDIDPTQIRILDKATYANVTEAHLSLYMDTYGPPLTMIEETLAAQLILPEPRFRDLFIEFDLSDVLKGNIEMRSAAYQRFLMSGVMTPNELRRLENLPAVNDRGADSVYVPLNMVALDGRIPSPAGSPVGQPALAAMMKALAEDDGTGWLQIRREDLGDPELLAAALANGNGNHDG